MISELFSVPVYRTVVRDLDLIQGEIGQVINAVQFEKLDRWGETHFLSRDPFGTDVISDYGLNNFKKEIMYHVGLYLSHVDFQLKEYNMQSWFVKFVKHSYAHIHSHCYADISGVYYYSTNGNDGDLFLENPITLAESSYHFYNKLSNRVVVKPFVGSLILFPGWLRHGVTTNVTDNSRISLAFNIDFIR